jgi:UDP-N-acetylmuramoyl-tripeptide--D-alanyl-D-alanine ligase
VKGRLHDLPRPEHRLSVSTSERGFSIVDDTFNSNPAGARSGLELLSRIGAGGRKVVVTPGMVELGPRQHQENRSFAAEAAAVVDDLLIVGGTNKRALLEGSATGTASVTVVASREDAVEWVRQNLGPGDAVLYENDLPDHYP